MLLNVNGTSWGTGAYNPVPTSFGPVTGTLTLTKIIDGDLQPTVTTFLTLENLTISWSNNTLTAAGDNFNFTEIIDVPPVVTSLQPLGIPQIAKPTFMVGANLLTTITTNSGVFNILTNDN